ncbi:hypothetical protein L195_g021282 [Trifolium pratense]|uniref:Uncharacterized protein n=1 Tax=Trifolium pratense TaxID=57577 RepID=A0A2K3N4U4_TRIPR|nr:hypothetical protein L195_g021282 [Trifolium pratense]
MDPLSLILAWGREGGSQSCINLVAGYLENGRRGRRGGWFGYNISSVLGKALDDEEIKSAIEMHQLRVQISWVLLAGVLRAVSFLPDGDPVVSCGGGDVVVGSAHIVVMGGVWCWRRRYLVDAVSSDFLGYLILRPLSKSVKICMILFESLLVSKSVEICRFLVFLVDLFRVGVHCFEVVC